MKIAVVWPIVDRFIDIILLNTTQQITKLCLVKHLLPSR